MMFRPRESSKQIPVTLLERQQHHQNLAQQSG
jgi:hypothetical protein